MLMFAKISLKSFVYDMVDVFSFPNNKTQNIYNKNERIKCFLYLNLTDTDISSIFFVFICNDTCSLKESYVRNLIFEILRHSKIAERLDSSHQIWLNYDFYKLEL